MTYSESQNYTFYAIHSNSTLVQFTQSVKKEHKRPKRHQSLKGYEPALIHKAYLGKHPAPFSDRIFPFQKSVLPDVRARAGPPRLALATAYKKPQNLVFSLNSVDLV